MQEEVKLVQRLTGTTSKTDIILNEEGWTSRVYIVGNGKFVVKFPRREEVKSEYEQEISLYDLLSHIRGEVQVPKLRWTDPGNEYIGYEGIVGTAFDQLTLPTGAMENIGEDLGQFLKQLHKLKLEGARTITIEDEIKEFQSKYELIKDVDSYFETNELELLRKFVFDTLPRQLYDLGFDPALCHGDLGYWNLILKKNNGVGVIDFGDIGYWDRSKDFIGMEDKTILESALKEYGDFPSLTEKIVARKKSLAILDLRFYAETNNTKGVSKTVTRLKSFIKEA